MDGMAQANHSGGLGADVMPVEARPPGDREATAPSPCRWPALAIAGLATCDVDGALAADPLFHRCPDGHLGRVEVRYWYFHPLNFSCWHCSEGGGVCVVDPDTVVCRHRMARPPGQPPRKQ